jgi:hypothetical protein
LSSLLFNRKQAEESQDFCFKLKTTNGFPLNICKLRRSTFVLIGKQNIGLKKFKEVCIFLFLSNIDKVNDKSCTSSSKKGEVKVFFHELSRDNQQLLIKWLEKVNFEEVPLRITGSVGCTLTIILL